MVRMDKDGGAATVLMQEPFATIGIAHDDRAIYWAANASQFMKLAK